MIDEFKYLEKYLYLIKTQVLNRYLLKYLAMKNDLIKNLQPFKIPLLVIGTLRVLMNPFQSQTQIGYHCFYIKTSANIKWHSRGDYCEVNGADIHFDCPIGVKSIIWIWNVTEYCSSIRKISELMSLMGHSQERVFFFFYKSISVFWKDFLVFKIRLSIQLTVVQEVKTNRLALGRQTSHNKWES